MKKVLIVILILLLIWLSFIVIKKQNPSFLRIRKTIAPLETIEGNIDESGHISIQEYDMDKINIPGTVIKLK